jgi:6-phosphogluconate dehydrogenase
MDISSCEIGMVGLGVMGRNLLLNMADHGFSVAGFDNDPQQITHLQEESRGYPVQGTADLKTFLDLIRPPRAIMLLVPAGNPVDSVIQTLLPHLQAGDLIIDAGNSYFKDTDKRSSYLATKQIQFMGVGISGGEAGARHGPSIMPGGSKEAYERVCQVFEAVAAHVNDAPCVSYLGSGSVGHFVKMVHNGIEYGIMQLIAESYDLMKRGLHLNNDQLSDVYREWNEGALNSYLIEITSRIFKQQDTETDKRLIEVILGVARQKGTGLWTSQSAMELQIPTPTIDLAVAMRDLSVFTEERSLGSRLYQRPLQPFTTDSKTFLTQLRHALLTAIIITYAQGMSLLQVASDHYHYDLNLETVARIWRGGCIIRSALLDNFCEAFRAHHNLPNLLLDSRIARLLMAHQRYLRQIVCQAIDSGIPTPGLATSLSYFDAYRSTWLPANLIQAQRDYFGSHRYERIDAPGTFHTEWAKKI